MAGLWGQKRRAAASGSGRAGGHAPSSRKLSLGHERGEKTALGCQDRSPEPFIPSSCEASCEPPSPPQLSPPEARELTIWEQESVAEINFHGVRST